MKALQDHWIWAPEWVDIDVNHQGSAARLCSFTKTFSLQRQPRSVIIHCTADTRYKLLVNSHRVAVGPGRSSPECWLYDTLNIAPFLHEGENHIEFLVLRFFLTSRAGHPFVRTPLPGLTVIGEVEEISLTSGSDWRVRTYDTLWFPTGLIDDVFLHDVELIKKIFERASAYHSLSKALIPVKYGFRSVNGELPPWRLLARPYPQAAQTPVRVSTILSFDSSIAQSKWDDLLDQSLPLRLPGDSRHTLDLCADVHSTAYVTWAFRSDSPTAQVTLKVTYSEGYESQPRQYPFLRTKGDRLDQSGLIIGPFDEVTLQCGPDGITYEPFWFRTFRILRVSVQVHEQPVDLVSLTAIQTNYPLDVKASWDEPQDEYSNKMWDISIRTLRNCMFDGYSDCPFYEQLQYSGDTRSVSLFHYLLSGDDRLARHAITLFAGSVTPEGLTQSRYPSHIPQLIAGFPLYWILQVCDHYLYFGNGDFVRPLLARIDGILGFFDRHVDELGLVSGIPSHIWQYVDWVEGWHATDDHPDKGVPTAGRASNRHTFFSMLYSLVLRSAATLLNRLGSKHTAAEYERRSEHLVKAINSHCYDGRFFTDSTSDQPTNVPVPYSQHCQVFAVLCGAIAGPAAIALLKDAFSTTVKLGKCSYVMLFYACRAFSLVEGDLYEEFFASLWEPFRANIRNNLTTWEEDDVRQRSDCHAWGSIPIYEYCVEVVGLRPLEAGWLEIEWRPRTSLSKQLQAKIALGKDNWAEVSWSEETRKAVLRLARPISLVTRDTTGQKIHHGMTVSLSVTF